MNYEIEEYEAYYRGRDPMAERAILHSDLNNFFASVECAMRPELKGCAIAVCGDEKARHGIVLAKNEEAKKFGIKTGETAGDARRKCAELVICQTHYSDYVRYSRAVREIYMNYATRIEPFGIDEAWIDISELAKRRGGDIFASARAIAEEIRCRVKRELGVTVSIGVSFNKTFSKLASDMKKPDAVTVISYGEFKSMIWNKPVSDLIFVGRRTNEELRRMKIEKVGELARQKRSLIKARLGKFGESLWDRANGYDLSPVAYYDNTDGTKSISNSTTTPFNLVTEEAVKATLLPLAEDVTEQMRQRNITASTVKLYIKYADFSSFIRQKGIRATASTEEIFSQAMSLFDSTRDLTLPIRSVGISAEGFASADIVQQDVFEAPRILDSAIDALRNKYGDSVIKMASVMKNNPEFNKKHVAFNTNI